MLTYSRGQWSDDPEYSDDGVKWGKNDQLLLNGYEKNKEMSIGHEHGINISFYCADDRESKYQFYACFSTGNRYYDCLVADFPSLLMLINTAMPIIKFDRDDERFEIMREEHEWKAKDLESHEYRRSCGHI
jgi:hypothetical protein